jgi:serine phosphatase RsbU (regulator of sigma subunit)
MLQDEMGNFWVGTWGGLTILDKEKKTYKRFLPNENDSTTISDDKIFALFVDSKGRFWIGTAGGLNLCNRADNTFRAFRVKDGLPSDAIYGILEDNQGNLWLSTANGLSKFNPDKKIFKNYFSDDGLQSNQFKEHAYVRLKSGEMAFGGVNGVNIFNPQNIRDNTFVPPVVITDFRIFNQSVPISKRSILRQDISITKEITLSYSQSVISFDFAALNYEVPEKNQYAYMMEGFEQKWNYVQDQKNATYTNLDPGEYIFKVKASNNDGVWNQKGTYLKIIIKPPFWKTWWFNTLCIIGLILLVFSIILYRDSKIKEQKKELERQVKERTSEIVQKNEELEAQTENLRTANNEIREKEQKLNIIYNEIRDNIRAAEVIQKYILPSQDYIKKHLCESFILYKPKDVVSGDFYWFDQLHGKKIIAVADCTGHGVSGAFMSINGHHLLNQAIFSNNFSTASDILDRLNEGVVKEFHKAYRETDFKDGMDVSLCIIDEQNLKLQFSGANHPLYLLRDNEIIQVKGNRFSIGTIIRNQIGKFSNHIIDLRKGDLVYLFSDGYADQIGGENGEEKFMYPRFRELLLEISHLRMNEQQNILSEQFESWKGRNSQLDDVLVIGFKI